MIPAELRALKGWLLWKSVHVAGESKPRKVPCYVDGTHRRGVQGSPGDRRRWATYDEAARVLADDLAGVYEGLGLVFSPDWGIVGLDFDHCVNATGDVDADGFFSDAGSRGVKVGDIIRHRNTTTAAAVVESVHIVNTVSSTYPGAANVSVGVTTGTGGTSGD